MTSTTKVKNAEAHAEYSNEGYGFSCTEELSMFKTKTYENINSFQLNPRIPNLDETTKCYTIWALIVMLNFFNHSQPGKRCL